MGKNGVRLCCMGASASHVGSGEKASGGGAELPCRLRSSASSRSTFSLRFRFSPQQVVLCRRASQARPPTPKRLVSVVGSRVAVRLTLRSSSAEIVSAIDADKVAFIQAGHSSRPPFRSFRARRP